MSIFWANIRFSMMKMRHQMKAFWGSVPYAIVKILRYQMILLGIAMVLCVVYGRYNLNALGYYWAMIGVVIIAFSLFSAFGGWGSLRSFSYQFGMTIGQSALENAQSTRKELQVSQMFVYSTFAQAIWAVIGGGLLTLIGDWLKTL